MSTRLRFLVFLLPLALFIALALLLWNRNGTDPSMLPSARLQQPVPAFALPSLTDPAVTLTADQLKGQVLLLNVWATWCVSCLVEHPVLMRLASEGVPIVGVNYKDQRPAALRWLENNGNPYSLIIEDARGDLAIDLGVYGAPETYLIDRDGRIRYRAVGVLDERAWRDEVQPRYQALLAEAATTGKEG